MVPKPGLAPIFSVPSLVSVPVPRSRVPAWLIVPVLVSEVLVVVKVLPAPMVMVPALVVKPEPVVILPLVRVMMPVLVWLPCSDRFPSDAHKVPSLVQLVPVTVMVEAASSALMVPWLARPSEAEPTTPLLVPWIRTPAPISNVLPALLERTTLPVKVPPKTISPVPLMAWVALPSNTRLVLKPTLFVLFSVTLPPASTSPPSAMLSVDALPTITSPASVMLLSVAVVDPARVALVPPLVASVPFWISAPLLMTAEPVLPAAPRS